MLIAQISDLHIPKPGSKTYGIAPMAENLAECITHLNQLSPQPDIVLVTGDISSTGTFTELNYAATLLAQLQMPFYVIPGNHDDRQLLWDAFNGEACPCEKNSFIQYVIDQHELRLIALDSTIPRESGGEICEQRVKWLDKCLAEDNSKPTIIFMHHPPIKCGVQETDLDGFIGSQQLGKVIEKYNNIEAVVCGHIHRPAHSRWHGTVVSTAPSMGMQEVLDLNLETEAFVLEAPAYQLHYWTSEQTLITHTEYLHDCSGPYLFKEYKRIKDK